MDTELIQMPFSVLDRRPVASGMLAQLKENGTEVHARSVFLQGLLLMEPSELGDFFAPLQPALAELHCNWARAGLTPLAGCVRAVLRQSGIDALIVGVNRRWELEDIVSAIEDAGNSEFDDTFAADIDPVYLDPRRWPPRTAP